MVQGNAVLVVDLGNSSTKGKVLFGKDSTSGKFRSRKFDISNVFAPIPTDYEVSDDYNTDTSTILKVETELDGHSIVGNYCNGELQEREKPLSTIKPSASSKKYHLDSTVLSMRLAFLYGYKAIMEMQRVNDYDQLDITWTVVTLLPPGDIDDGKIPMTQLVKSVTSFEAVYPKVSKDINITKVVVLPEGYCAYAGVIYDVGHTFRPDYKFLTGETVLVIDIGAGTTDILMIASNKLVQNSKYTISQGGNNVYQLVRRSIMKTGTVIDEADIRNGVISGYVKDGSKQVSIVDYVNEAKQEVAQKIVSEIQDFLELTDIKARSVGYVLVCGGGSMQDSDVQAIKPLSERIIESFKQLSPNSELVEIPTHVVTKRIDEDTTDKVEEQISPRELNLIGASILAELL